MALKKAIVQPNGATAEYWRISAIGRPISGCLIVVDGYVSAEARATGKIPLARRSFKAGSIASVDAAYTFLKTLPAFSGSEDA